MKLTKPVNSNYAALVTKISKTIPIEGANTVQIGIVLGNSVVISKELKEGDVGIYFPLECALSKEYLEANNLYNKYELNSDTTKKGYFDTPGRVRAQRFMGNKSEGLFMPLNSLSFIFSYSDEDLKIGDEFDTLYGVPICHKYVPRNNKGIPKTSIKHIKKEDSKIIENQFQFHKDTKMMFRNLNDFNPDTSIHISYKVHGTSGISSYVLCKRKLNLLEKILLKLRVNINTTEYDYIYSSRKVIKNPEININPNHFYGEDIWGLAHSKIKDVLTKGMSIYYEIIGFLPNGQYIQSNYDYGCKENEFNIQVYRITNTDPDGKVFEYSPEQVQDFCKSKGLNHVDQLFLGYAKDLFPYNNTDSIEDWRDGLLDHIKSLYNDKDCYMCKNKVPEEGAVVRINGPEFNAYKVKSEKFYRMETSNLDKGLTDIEEEN